MFLPSPGSRQRWPNSAACWSPATPRDRHLEAVEVVRARACRARRSSAAARAASAPGCRRRARAAPGPTRPWRCPSAASATAFEGSVTCSPVSLKSIHESTVPNTARPSRARSASPSTLRSSHSILVAEKYGSSISPVRSRMRSSSPASRSSSQRRGGAAVLPDERVVQRLARRRVPADDGLALVGDPDRLELAGLQPRVLERLAGDRVRDLPDLRRVVLDPARLREVLGELAVAAADALPLQVEHEAGGAGRPLVDGQQHARGNATLRACRRSPSPPSGSTGPGSSPAWPSAWPRTAPTSRTRGWRSCAGTSR